MLIYKTCLLLSSLCLTLVGITTASADAPQPLRVLAYNIHHGEGLDRRLDLPRIAEVIKSTKADLVLLQEVDRVTKRTGGVDQAAELAELTGMHHVFGGNLKFEGGDYGNAILSRFPISASQNYSLPNETDGEPRGVLGALISLPSSHGGQTCRVLSTHFDHRSANDDRLASVIALKELIQNWPEPSILGGDFNMTRDNPAMRLLLEQWTIAGDEELPTIPAQVPTKQIDFITFRPADKFTVQEVRVLEEPIASDHRPILAVLRLK